MCVCMCVYVRETEKVKGWDETVRPWSQKLSKRIYKQHLKSYFRYRKDNDYEISGRNSLKEKNCGQEQTVEKS